LPSGWMPITYKASWPTVTVCVVGMAEITKLAAPTVCERGVDVLLAVSKASPEYEALMLYVPRAKLETESVAIPVDSKVPWPRTTAGFALLLVKVTVPVGVPPTCGDTVAVNTTGPPKKDGFGAEVIVMVVACAPIVTGNAAETLAAVLASPLYVAVMECGPGTSVEIVKVATPVTPTVCTATDPRVVEPSAKVTVPVGISAPDGVTVAVNVMLEAAGLGLDAVEVSVVEVPSGISV